MIFPFISRKTHERALALLSDHFAATKARLERENAEERELLRVQLERLVRIDYAQSARRHGVYQLTLRFSPETFAFGSEGQWLDYLANDLGRRVMHEIRSSRFVKVPYADF